MWRCKHRIWRHWLPSRLAVVLGTVLSVGAPAAWADDGAATPPSPASATGAARIDALLEGDSAQQAPVADAIFLRRVSLDLTGVVPSPEQVQAFCDDPDPDKRRRMVEELLATEAYARNWARYWRDVIAYRATDQRTRLAVPALENWLTEQFAANVGWDQIATELVTATGDVRENGNTFLVLAQMGQAVELAAETSRIFLGIQIQCAQCHDHPYDDWKREQFHQLAAFYSRIRIQRTNSPLAQLGRPPQLIERFDDDGDGKLAIAELPERYRAEIQRVFRRADRDNDKALSPQELQVALRQGGRSFQVVSTDRQPVRGPAARFNRPRQLLTRFDADSDGKLKAEEFPEGQLRQLAERFLRRADRDNDAALSLEELQTIRRQLARRGGGGREHRMPDLNDPQAPGTVMHPVFFVSDVSPGERMPDVQRRKALAEYLTSPENPWFARALVNRVWAALMGWGFYEPIDDLGPGREAEYPEVLDSLAEGFVSSRYDIKWLLRTIASTKAYQREAQPSAAAVEGAVVCPSRLRADQLFEALETALGGLVGGGPRGGQAAARRRGGVRNQFQQLFGYDPSTPAEELSDSIPQALFLMNNPLVNRRISARGNTTLSRLLRNSSDDTEAIEQLYLRVLAREPSEGELQQCREYLDETEDRREGFEDILWCLLNSTEFRLKH